jgi:thiosulfate dehydrogenase [quinone] large subunit
MTHTPMQRALVFALRIMLGWVFLWAGFRQVFLTESFSAAQFLEGAKTFPEIFKWLASPPIVPTVSFLVKWGHLLIGLSLVGGLMVRTSSAVGAVLLVLYYLPRLEFPFVGPGQTNLIVEYHLILAAALLYVGRIKAGTIWGLDTYAEKLPVVGSLIQRYPPIKSLFD